MFVVVLLKVLLVEMSVNVVFIKLFVQRSENSAF